MKPGEAWKIASNALQSNPQDIVLAESMLKEMEPSDALLMHGRIEKAKNAASANGNHLQERT